VRVKAKTLDVDILDYIPRVGEEVLVRGRITGWRTNLDVQGKHKLLIKFPDGLTAEVPLDSVYEVEEWTTTKG